MRTASTSTEPHSNAGTPKKPANIAAPRGQSANTRGTGDRLVQLLQSLWFKFRNQDRGQILLEAIVSISLIGAIGNGMVNGSIGSTKIQTGAINHSVASQATDDQFEAIKATAWQNIGTLPAKGTASDYLLGRTGIHAGTIDPKKTVTVRGITMTISTAVGWETAPKNGSSYGVKVIVVETTWKNRPDAPVETIKRSHIITPGVNEAAPSKVWRG